MNAPFYKFGLFGDGVSLVAAFAIGLGFGFFLERAGFGSARKLAAQFYFRDLAVLKVMFTAIVTAMVGLFLLSAAGVVDLSQVTLKPTNLGANLLGGLILGVGFVIGGYCPGTSVASAATGRSDAWVYLGGMLAGTLAFGELMGSWPALAAFVDDADKPRMTLSQWSGIPYGALVLGVVIMAVVAFMLAEWAEVRFGGRPLGEQPLIGAPPATWNMSRILMGMLFAGALVAALVGDPYRGATVALHTDELARLVQVGADRVAPSELADRILAGDGDFRLVDVRPAGEFARGTLPGAESLPLADLPSRTFRPTQKVILFSQDPAQASQAWIFLKARGMTSVYVLAGGLEAWNSEVLHPRVGDPPTEADGKRIARARAFGGTPMTGGGGPDAAKPLVLPDQPGLAAPPPPAPPAAPQAAPRKKREGC